MGEITAEDIGDKTMDIRRKRRVGQRDDEHKREKERGKRWWEGRERVKKDRD